MKSQASALWHGGLKDGNGTISTTSGALDNTAYSFRTRFEEPGRLNPEELIAAAHAACFTMALAKQLGEVQMVPKQLLTTAEVNLEPRDGLPTITQIHLDVEAEIYGADPTVFMTAATTAKDNCPVSRLFNAEITLEARLDSEPPVDESDWPYETGLGGA
jgi:osmotically inducible protein OsmC